MQKILLDVRDLSVRFFTRKNDVPAVENVSFHINDGEVLGIVGESGSGKSVSALSIIGLIQEPGRITGGRIVFKDENLLEKSEEEMTNIRGNKISMIFQEPMTSFNPVYTVGGQIMEAIALHQNKKKLQARELTVSLMREVGIASPEKRISDYPHQMSGGMLQRCMIAMALSCNPELLIADEPTTSLDVTIQAQILDLIRKLQHERNTSIIMITHDLGIIAELAKYVVVMYLGRVVEKAPVRELFRKPLHPYAEGLLRSRTVIGQNGGKLYMIPASNMDPRDIEGCRFCPRCEFAFDRCKIAEPPLTEIGDGRSVRCWLRLLEK